MCVSAYEGEAEGCVCLSTQGGHLVVVGIRRDHVVVVAAQRALSGGVRRLVRVRPVVSGAFVGRKRHEKARHEVCVRLGARWGAEGRVGDERRIQAGPIAQPNGAHAAGRRAAGRRVGRLVCLGAGRWRAHPGGANHATHTTHTTHPHNTHNTHAPPPPHTHIHPHNTHPHNTHVHTQLISHTRTLRCGRATVASQSSTSTNAWQSV